MRTAFFLSALAGLLVATCAALGPSTQAAPAREGLLRWAYYVPEDPASLASLRQRNGDLDYVALHWATLKDGGSLEVKGSAEVLALVRSLGARPILSVSAASVEGAHALLATEASRAALVDTLARALAQYDGLSIDIEGLPPQDRAPLTQFMAQLAGRLRPAGKLVTMAISAKTWDAPTGWAASMDFAALAPHADLFVLMAYGFRTGRSTVPGSTAPLSWVEASLAFAVSQIPPARLLLGVPFYGYDWDTTAGPPARALRHADATALAAEHGATIQRDPIQQAARFSYAKDGHTHEVWFEDRASVDAKLALIPRYGVAGMAGWRLGHEDPQVWQSLSPRAAPTPIPPPSPSPSPSRIPSPSSSPTPIPPPSPSPSPSPSPERSWYFAEGSSSAPFDTWFLLQNPNPAPANARLTFMLEGGRTVVRNLTLGPTSRTSVFTNQIVPEAAFSTRVEADQPLFAERAMYAGFDGHAVTAATSPARTWYFADGATTAPFHTWILLQNPNSTPTGARLSYLREDGSSTVQTVGLAANSRASVFVNQVLPNTAFSTRVDGDQPIIAERAMYRFPGNAATGVTGTTAASRTWYFAGALPTFQDLPVDSWLLLQNPSPSAVTATITFMSAEGRLSTIQRLLGPTSRQSVYVNPLFSAPSFGLQVEATGEIVAEKSVYLGSTAFSGNEPQGAMATQGAPRLGTAWMLPEGSTAPPFSEKISVLNPHASPMSVRFDFMLESGQVVVHNATVSPTRILDLEVGGLVPSAALSTRVTTSLPSVVERSMFWTKEGKIGAHSTVGIRLE